MTRKVLTLVLGAFLVLGAAACDDDGDDASVSDGGATEETGEATSEAIPGGEQVTMSGTVDEVVAGRAFTMTDATVVEGSATTDGDLAVILSDDDATVSASDQVTVTGTLFEVDVADEVAELEDLFGVTLDPDALAALGGRQLLLASSVEAEA